MDVGGDVDWLGVVDGVDEVDGDGAVTGYEVEEHYSAPFRTNLLLFCTAQH